MKKFIIINMLLLVPITNVCMLKEYLSGESLHAKHPLIDAINNKNIEEVKRLLRTKEANPNEEIVNVENNMLANTALWRLIMNRKDFEEKDVVETVTLFINRRVYLNFQIAHAKKTVLHYVIEDKIMYLIDIILAAKPNVNAQDAAGETPLHSAIKQSYTFEGLLLVEKLIAAGANVNIQNKCQETPLHYAAQYNAKKDVFETLLKHGADSTIKDYYQKTPYEYARDPEIKNLLKQ